MVDLKLTADGDLDCSEHGLHLVDGQARVAQQLRTRLRTFLGEWEWDTAKGTPWFQRMLGIKVPNLVDVEAALVEQILTVADVTGILSFKLDLARGPRQMSVVLAFQSTFGPSSLAAVLP